MSEQNKLYIPQSIMDNLSLLAKKQLSEMTELQQAEFVDSYRRKAKSTGIGYVCWLFSLHYAYVGQWGLEIIFLCTMGGFFIWWLVDAFRVPGIINNYNRDVAMDILREIKLMSK